MPSYLDTLKPGRCPICEGRGLVYSSGDGWDEWDDCRICRGTGTLTEEMVAAERADYEAMERRCEELVKREREIEAIMLEIDPDCFKAGDIDRWRAVNAAADAQLAARAAQ